MMAATDNLLHAVELHCCVQPWPDSGILRLLSGWAGIVACNEVPEGWTLDKEIGAVASLRCVDGGGKDTSDTAWVNDISLPEVSALSDLNMEISTTSVRCVDA
eukprot:6299295-Amphidinium_carterae.1